MMAIRKILRIGSPVLRQVSQPVPDNEMGSKELKNLIKDMHQTMNAANGVGLAAPQIGVLKQVVVVGQSDTERYADTIERSEYMVIINPKITPQENEVRGYWEGCLSVPDMRGYVERVRKIRMQWVDQHGTKFDEIIEGFDAVVYQHECDHLKGELYIDKLKDPLLFGFNEELDDEQDE